MPPEIQKIIKLIYKKDLLLPLVLIVVYVIFLFIIKGVLPTADELIDHFASFYIKYGYEILFVSAFLEALILVNLFAPGMIALALGIIFARTGQTDLTLVVIIVSLGAICGYMLDFILGYFGFSDILRKIGYQNFLDTAKVKLKQFGRQGLILSFINANIASFMSLAAGATNMNWLVFFLTAFFSTVVWVTFWGLLIYSLGDMFLIIFRKYSVLVVLFAIGLVTLSGLWKRPK